MAFRPPRLRLRMSQIMVRWSKAPSHHLAILSLAVVASSAYSGRLLLGDCRGDLETFRVCVTLLCWHLVWWGMYGPVDTSKTPLEGHRKG